jgi:hypothetical protein
MYNNFFIIRYIVIIMKQVIKNSQLGLHFVLSKLYFFNSTSERTIKIQSN